MARDTILILDVDRHITWALKTLLEGEGYSAMIAETTEEALRESSRFQVSGLLTEYRIHDHLTIDTVRKLNETLPGIYVMMMTDVEVTEDDYREILGCGVDDFFYKPVSITKILLHLEKGLRYRELLAERVGLEVKHHSPGSLG